MDDRLKNWEELTEAGLIEEAGSARRYSTASWKTACPHIDLEKCVHCLLCWWFCPDSAVRVENSRISGFDLTHCKGCGVCAAVCPDKVKAIRMEPVSEPIAGEKGGASR